MAAKDYFGALSGLSTGGTDPSDVSSTASKFVTSMTPKTTNPSAPKPPSVTTPSAKPAYGGMGGKPGGVGTKPAASPALPTSKPTTPGMTGTAPVQTQHPAGGGQNFPPVANNLGAMGQGAGEISEQVQQFMPDQSVLSDPQQFQQWYQQGMAEAQRVMTMLEQGQIPPEHQQQAQQYLETVRQALVAGQQQHYGAGTQTQGGFLTPQMMNAYENAQLGGVQSTPPAGTTMPMPQQVAPGSNIPQPQRQQAPPYQMR